MTRSYSASFFWLALTIGASLMLYHTSDRVHELDQQLRSLNAQIEAEQQSMHILKAEWVYLANPARVEATVHRHLDLQPTAPRRVVALKDIAAFLPLKDGVDAVPPVEVADATPPVAEPSKASAETVPTPVLKHKSEHIMAALNTGRINDHMIMQHTASVQEASTDSIGALIGTLGLRP